MEKLKNLNIKKITRLSSPSEIIGELPLSEELQAQVVAQRKVVKDILDGKDNRFLLIIGPCSIHHQEAGIEYARRLKKISDKVQDKIVIVMRAYFEKPRTILGWKGMVYDPFLNESNDIEAGIRQTRKMLLDIAKEGLPIATEILEPIIPQYISDLISWAAIGARTAESQPHRQMASGLSMPIGIKNSTDGSLNVAVEAIRSASAAHSFIGIDGDGHVAKFETKGNAYGHIVLRGGKQGANYQSEHIAYVKEILRKAKTNQSIVVDCSHANSDKNPLNQPKVMREVIAQRTSGTETIVGAMVESNLLAGRQDIPVQLCEIIPGLSITDGCIGWEDTEKLIEETYNILK